MQAADRGAGGRPEEAPLVPRRRNTGRAEQPGDPGRAAAPRRADEPPAPAMLLAPVIGLCIWGGLAAVLFF